ncbi:MAG: ribonuclease HII [Myxococcota bacterium]
MTPSVPPHKIIAEQLSLFGREKSFDIEEIEKLMAENGIRIFVGVDEAGRGPLAGPVVAAAVVLGDAFELSGIKDSKELSPAKREELYPLIKRSVMCYAIRIVGARNIDRWNIREAARIAMKRAVNGVALKLKKEYDLSPQMVLIDGKDLLDIRYEQRAVVKGDKRSVSIAAASILAKVYRDRLMMQYHKKFPVYNFAKNMGYPTAEHIEALKKFGASPHHRRTFKYVKGEQSQN